MTEKLSLPGRTLLKRLLRDYVWPHRKMIALAVLCMIAAAAATAANAWLMKPILDDIFLKQDREMLRIIPLVVLAVAIISGLANWGHNVMMRIVGQRIIANMQMQLFSHLMHSDIALFHDHATGRLISRFTNDINMMRASVSIVLTGLAKETLTMIFLVGVMFAQSWQLALIAFVVFPIAVLPVIRLGRRMRKVSDATQAELGHFTAQLDEIFQGVRMVKAYAREEYEISRAHDIIEKLFRLYVKAARTQTASGPIMEALGGVAVASVVWYGGMEVLKGVTTPGAFFSFIAAMIMAYRPAKVIAGLNTNLQEGLSAAARLFGVLDAKPTITDAPEARALTVTRGQIRYDNIFFTYGKSGAGVHGVTLDIPAGKTVALVGPSGGGKSTLMNLLLRFYDVNAGRISIDGVDISQVTLASLRQSMALVSQETVLFDDTVRANIAYGRLGASEEDITNAARMAAADDFIHALPQGYDTVVGPFGVKLSGGQRQRIAIARAMLKNAPILLLDEATSALDNESERAVQTALNALRQGRTTLVIAHRLSTVMDADLIYVIEAGKVAEAGTHAELLIKRGEYFRLYGEHIAAGDEIIDA